MKEIKYTKLPLLLALHIRQKSGICPMAKPRQMQFGLYDDAAIVDKPFSIKQSSKKNFFSRKDLRGIF